MTSLDVVAIGESLGLLVPDRPGRLAHVPHLRLGFGGAESNVAIGVARLGGRSAWVGRIGGDGLGELITRGIRAEGVEVHASVDPDAATALMIKERPRPGSSRVTYYRSVQAGSRLAAADIPDGVIERAAILHVTGISAGLGAGPLAAVHAAIDRAKAAGVTVSFDVNHRSALWRNVGDGNGSGNASNGGNGNGNGNGSSGNGSGARDAGDAYRELAARSDIVFAGDDEAALFTGRRDPHEQLDAIRALGVACAVIKLGEHGAIASEGEMVSARDAVRVDVVDTVGAGDAFVAGWLAETAAGASLEQRLEMAVQCGALACTVDGDWEAAPNRADVAALATPGADPVQR
jgi:2-dehydro-3-deoxygluconokinase